jgi:AcrR family transcriptional regulator
MAAIAERAGMSPGLIYRYFASKAEIVRAIIALQLERAAEVLDGLHSEGDLVRAMLEAWAEWQRPGCEGMSKALFLEMTAEATRDEEIAAATRAADEVVGQRVTEALRRCMAAAGTVPDDATVRRRALVLLCLIQGLAIRAVREPDLDPAVLTAALAESIAALVRG